MRDTPEYSLQKQVAWLLDESGLLWFHPANERKCTPAQGAILKALGVKAGVPDCLILSRPTRPIEVLMFPNLRGLAIELKSPKGRLTEAQAEFGGRLGEEGWRVVLCRSFEEAVETLRYYFPNNAFLQSVQT